MPKRNYHMSLQRVYQNEPRDWWRCDYCRAEGPVDDLRKTECKHVYEDCVYCGGCDESNECKPDCPGVLGLLAGLSLVTAETEN